MLFRFYKQVLKGELTALKISRVLFLMFLWAVIFCLNTKYRIANILLGALIGLILFVLNLFAAPLIVMLNSKKLLSAHEKYGYSVEYLRIYEREKITGKPFDLQNAINYAEIFRQLDQPADALNYLKNISVPENAKPFLRILYFHVYVLCALMIGDIEAAEEMWRVNTPLINSIKNKPEDCINSYLIYLSLIKIDCCAGRTERAYEQTVSYMNSEHYRRNPANNCEFDIILLYELKALGKTEEFNALLPAVKEKVYALDPIFTCEKQVFIKDFNDAANGKIPF